MSDPLRQQAAAALVPHARQPDRVGTPALVGAETARLPATIADPPRHVAPVLQKMVFDAIRPVAGKSRLRPRHKGVLVSFVLAVLLPVLVSAWYLWARAADQYASVAGFSVHREDIGPGLSLMGGLASISGSGSADTDVLYQYIRSQELVAELDHELDLRAIWSRPTGDPVFAFDPSGRIEDLVDYWQDMVSVQYDNSTRLIELRVLAFAPEDARTITAAILERSSAVINRLNNVAAADALAYAQAELDRTMAALVTARADVTRFRNLHQVVDPGAELATQSGVIGTLQQELTGAQVHLDLLRTTTVRSDRRLAQAERRVAVISAQIAAERSKLGQGEGDQGAQGYADLVAEFERLGVERQFAEEAYRAARVAYEVALAEAKRQGRYLAIHVQPTLPETARFPARLTLLALVAGFALALWSIAVLVYYSLRDRR